MAYRNGTYVAFHAQSTSDPTESDMKYYNLLRAWHQNDDIEFSMINSHEKTSAVRDSSSRETLRNRLKERLNNSKNMVLILGETTKLDTDWIPFEIAYAVDKCNIPIIVAYTAFSSVLTNADSTTAGWAVPTAGSYNDIYRFWPEALTERVRAGSARTVHIPFKMEPIRQAIQDFDHDNPPNWSETYYSLQKHREWGLI